MKKTKEKLAVNRSAQINQLHQECLEGARTTIGKAAQAGGLLIEQKKEVGHGNWEAWVEANLSFGPLQAWRYMRLALNPNLTSKKDLTIEDAARVSTRPSEQEIEEEVQERLRQAEEAEEAEEDDKIVELPLKKVVREFDPEEMIPLEESDEEFETRVQAALEELKAQRGSVQEIDKRKAAEVAGKMWSGFCQYFHKYEKVAVARVLIKLLEKTYPQLKE